MSLWTSSLLSILLLLPVQLPLQEMKGELKTAAPEEAVTVSEARPQPIVFSNKDRELTQAYSDLFKILSDENTCSDFYGGPRKATTRSEEHTSELQSH